MRYAFDNAGVQTRDRFTLLSSIYDPASKAALDRAGVIPGWRCLEIGCGNGTLATWMADRVETEGHVLATDLDPRWMPTATHPNLEVIRHDIVHDPLPDNEFDLVHARLVLLHLPEREQVLRRLTRCLRPNGLLLLEEFDCDWVPVLSAPTTAAAEMFNTVHATLMTTLRDAGAEPGWGRRAYSAMRTAGYDIVSSTTYAEAWPGGGHAIDLHRANTEQVSDKLQAAGISQSQLEIFWTLLRDARFAVSSYPLVSVIGRPPRHRDQLN
jgi:ubiquinone/menaquinone biosynthesis C-methylase UbiE